MHIAKVTIILIGEAGLQPTGDETELNQRSNLKLLVIYKQKNKLEIINTNILL